MNTASPYNQNPELVAMREDIANRTFALKIKSGLITAASVVGGVALGAVVFPASVPALVGGGVIGLMAGGKASDIFTLKDREKLKIDEDMVQSYMQGKNYWGEGYREEVAEHGYSLGGAPHPGNLPPHTKAPAQQR